MKITQLIDISAKKIITPTVLFTTLLPLNACSTAPKNKKDTTIATVRRPRADADLPRVRNGNLDLSGLHIREVDVNGDGNSDLFEYANDNGEVLVVMRDLNFDGKPDDWQYFDTKGELLDEEMDLDFDGHADNVDVYKNKRLDHKLQTTDYSGEFQIIKYFNKNGELIRIERDTDNDGIYETIDFYDKAFRTKTAYDDNGDGKPDRFEGPAT